MRAAHRSVALRARVGLLGYPGIFAVLGSSAGLIRTHSQGFVALFSLILLVTALRGYLIQRFDALYDRRPRLWQAGFYGGLLLVVAVLGGASYLLIREEGLTPASIIALAAVAILAPVAIFLYAGFLVVSRSYLLLLLGPTFFALLQSRQSGGDTGVLIGTAFYLIYLFIVAEQQHAERWQGLSSTLLLTQRATELEHAQEDLRGAHDDLERLVAERTAELEKASQDYRRIFENAHDAILVLDPQGEIVLNVNHRACELYGFPREEFIGLSLESVSENPLRGREHVAKTLDLRTAYTFESRQRRRDGTPMVVEVNASVIEYEGRPAILSINRDLTDRLKTQELQLAKEAAERADRAKSQFLANMSHEIRTPMAGILGLADLLLKTDLTANQRRYTEMTQGSAASLLQLIDDILDFSKIEAGKLSLEEVAFPLRATLTETIELMRFEARSRNLDLRLELADDLPDWVTGDPGRLRQVLVNLVGNSIKFTERGFVEARAETGPPGWVRIAVQDTGVGIPAEARERLFEPFSQADSSTSRRYGGSGLGLTISRRIVEGMNGKLDFTSRPGRGSTFWFTVPLPAAPPPAAPPPVHPVNGSAPPLPKRRILLAEDHPVNQLVVGQQLAALGYEVTAVGDGLEALAALERSPYDLVLLDCQMPQLDGYETSRRIRSRSGERWHVPVVALTAHAMRGDRERCLEAGMNDYLTKPCRKEDLQRVLERWLRNPPQF